jgi:hypothetical protein
MAQRRFPILPQRCAAASRRCGGVPRRFHEARPHLPISRLSSEARGATVVRMKKLVTVIVAAAVSFVAAPARAQDDAEPAPSAASSGTPPSSGVGLLVTGGIFTGIGGLNLLTAPLCKTSLIQQSVQDTCLDAALVVGGIGLAVGIPLFIVGANKRADYNAWRRTHPVPAGFSLAPTTGGATLGWRVVF